MKLFREDYLVLSAEVHECEQTEKTIVICIEVTILIRFVLRVPESVDELTADLMIAQERSRSDCRYEADRMTENLCPTSCSKDILLFRK